MKIYAFTQSYSTARKRLVSFEQDNVNVVSIGITVPSSIYFEHNILTEEIGKDLDFEQALECVQNQGGLQQLEGLMRDKEIEILKSCLFEKNEKLAA